MAHKQKQIILNRKKVWVDEEMVPLIKALNEAGLKTYISCTGDKKWPRSVTLKTDNIETVHHFPQHKQLTILWYPKKKRSGRRDHEH